MSKSKYSDELHCSHAGLRDNPAITNEEIRALERQLAHDPGQLKARTEGAFTAPAGLALRFDPERHYETMDVEAALELIRKGFPFAGIDFGAWRFAFVLLCADRIGRAHVLEEYFSQKEDLETRAKRIDLLLDKAGIDKLPIWGDLANLQDIIEINEAFRRIDSRRQVMPVAAENKIRKVSVERLNSLLKRDALLVRRGIGEKRLDGKPPTVWRLGQDAAHEGQPVVGSRLTWEIGAWAYPEPKEGKAQAQDPDDNSADGSDMIAALRYAVMSWWTAAKYDVPGFDGAWDPRALAAEAEKRRIPVRKTRPGPKRAGRQIRHPDFGELW